MVLKHSKRPFDGDESCNFVHKHLKQLEWNGLPESCPAISSSCSDTKDPLFSVSEELIITNTPNDFVESAVYKSIKPLIPGDHSAVISSLDPFYLGDSNGDLSVNEFTKTLVVHDTGAMPASSVTSSAKEFNSLRNYSSDGSSKFTFGSVSSWSWPPLCSLSEGDARFELPLRASSFAFFEDDYQTVKYGCREDVSASAFDSPRRKLVAIGPKHQADIPLWVPPDSTMFVGQTDIFISKPHHSSKDEESNSEWVDISRGDCFCLDEGSVRCVRQHVAEARKKLEQNLGLVKFVELGFDDMGEVVSQSWSYEEEIVFQEVVFANPSSMGKNFWDHLQRVFPSRSSQEIVSYYFNVFMLRKRAEQNRLDPENADSDNDEWQASEVDGEFDDDEDSAVESPVDVDDINCENGGARFADFHEETEDVDACDNGSPPDSCNGGRDDTVEMCGVNELNPLRSGIILPKHNVDEDPDVQDDSCTSYEEVQNCGSDCGPDPTEYPGKGSSVVLEHKKFTTDNANEGVNGDLADPLYVVSHCDQKEWDSEYFSGSEKGVDFLPTCSVIEEVFGKGSWSNGVEDHGVV